MANNCWNYIEITGSPEDLLRFKTDLDLEGDSPYDSLLERFDPQRELENPRWFEIDVIIYDTSIHIGGGSAWTPALDLFTEISKHYESFKIKYSYEESGSDFAGWADISEGLCSDNCFGYAEGIIERDGEYEMYDRLTEYELECYSDDTLEEFLDSHIYSVFKNNKIKHDLKEDFIKMKTEIEVLNSPMTY